MAIQVYLKLNLFFFLWRFEKPLWDMARYKRPKELFFQTLKSNWKIPLVIFYPIFISRLIWSINICNKHLLLSCLLCRFILKLLYIETQVYKYVFYLDILPLCILVLTYKLNSRKTIPSLKTTRLRPCINKNSYAYLEIKSHIYGVNFLRDFF